MVILLTIWNWNRESTPDTISRYLILQLEEDASKDVQAAKRYDFLSDSKNRQYMYLRNEFNFWNVHEIMNTSGILQSLRASR